MLGGAEGEWSSERELRDQLALTQSIAHIGSWEWTIASGSVTWSDELYRIYGFEPGSVPITLELFLSRIHPDERERVQREIHAVLQHPGRFAYRERIVRPDGTTRTLDTMGNAIVDEHGAVVRLFGTCRDITEVVARDERIQFYADVFEHAAIGLSAYELDATDQPRLVAFNAATERLLGVSLGAQLGTSLATIAPALRDVAPGPATSTALAPFRIHATMLAPKLFAMPNRHACLVLEDVTEQVRNQRVQAAERRALEMLAAGEPIPAILDAIVRGIEDAMVDTIASILLFDESGSALRHGAAPSLPAAYNARIDGMPVGACAGSCGTATFRREPVITIDVDTDPLWEDYRELAREHGLRSCWSFPILAEDDRVLGTFALYHRTPSTPDAAAHELMARAAHVTGIVIERRVLDEDRRAQAGRIEQVREDERTAIARDVHDQLGQALTALKLDIGWLQRRTQDPALQGKLDDMARASDEILRTVRRIAAELRPSLLDDLGLRAAIEWQAEEFTQRTSTVCVVRSDVTDLRLEHELATNVFRIFQEALTNITRHAGAQRVEVSLRLEHGQLLLEIADDGVGSPEIGPRGTLGILGMRERASRFGGECTVKRRSPTGTIVTVSVPLRFPSERTADGDP